MGKMISMTFLQTVSSKLKTAQLIDCKMLFTKNKCCSHKLLRVSRLDQND